MNLPTIACRSMSGKTDILYCFYQEKNLDAWGLEPGLKQERAHS